MRLKFLIEPVLEVFREAAREAGRREGFAVGLEEGRAEAREAAVRAAGRKQGRAEGQQAQAAYTQTWLEEQERAGRITFHEKLEVPVFGWKDGGDLKETPPDCPLMKQRASLEPWGSASN